ncbi:MAG: hypothetical protein GWP19_05395 [Planctomycetia bacterium]|nr:hypothetical protein [Planctomycetia bacterium]
MIINELIKQLGDNYPDNEDMNFESFKLEMEQKNASIQKISYGDKYGPIMNIPGFTIILKLNLGTVLVDLTYGPKIKEYLSTYYSKVQITNN